MRTRLRIGGAALVLVFAVAAGAQERKGDEKPLTDADFVKKAVSCGLAEVEMAKIAKDRASDPDVKKFAESIITDHTKVNEELAKIAKEANIPAPMKPEPEQQRHVDMIRDYKGADFDKMFVKHMIDDHEKDVKLFTQAGRELKNEKLKDFAEKTLPALKDHLDMARKIHERLDKK
jgi:putative membrane protein